MIKLEPHEVCPMSHCCEHRLDYCDGLRTSMCGGCNPNRSNVFVCDFFSVKRNFEEEVSKAWKEMGV